MDSNPVNTTETPIVEPKDDVMSRVFDMVRTQIAKENAPPPKKKRNRVFSEAQRRAMLANLKKGREAKLAKNRERKRLKAEAAEKVKAVAPKKDVVAVEVKKVEPKPEPERKPLPAIAPPVVQPMKPASPITLDFRFGGTFF